MAKRKEPQRPQVELPSPEADELVVQAIGGDADAFAVLFRLSLPTIHRYLYGRCGDVALAEDLAQDSYISAMRAIGTSFQGGSKEFVAWMIRIARNRFLDHVKSGRVRWEYAVSDVPVTLSTHNPEADAVATIEGIDLRRALGTLTPEQQEVVYLRFLQGLQTAEVAMITGRTEGAVKALQLRALRVLSKNLTKEDLFAKDDG